MVSERRLDTSRIKLGLSLFWFLFTFSLVVWWWVFSFHQLELLADVVDKTKYQSLRRMLLSEGAVLVVAVFFGGLAMVVLTARERSRNERLRNFFSNFTHDLKTSLTRLRLRTEVLAEKNSSPEFQKLLEEAGRLDLQLENSLWVARGDSQKLLQEDIKLSSIIGFLRVEWPALEVRLVKEAEVRGDGQALKSVFRNILQNAWLHGEAKRIEIAPERIGDHWQIVITDDGKGYRGDLNILGSQLLQSESEKGNGLGLYLTHDLVRRMQGKIEYEKPEKGFRMKLMLSAAEVKNG